MTDVLEEVLLGNSHEKGTMGQRCWTKKQTSIESKRYCRVADKNNGTKVVGQRNNRKGSQRDVEHEPRTKEWSSRLTYSELHHNVRLVVMGKRTTKPVGHRDGADREQEQEDIHYRRPRIYRAGHADTQQRYLLSVGCLTSQQRASASQGRICSDKYKRPRCHTETERSHSTLTPGQLVRTRIL